MKFPEIKRAKESDLTAIAMFGTYKGNKNKRAYDVDSLEEERKSRAKWVRTLVGWVGGLKYQTGIALEKQVFDIQKELERQAKEDEK